MKEQIKKLLPKNRFARSVSILAGGTAAGQAVVVLASPLLTRLYSPEDFGLLAVYASLLGIIGVVASLRYQLAIPLPEKDEEAAHVVVLSLLVVLGMTLLTILVVVFFRDPIAQAVNMPVLANYLWLLPLGLLLTGIYDIFNYWAIRIKAFPAIARTKLTQSLSMVGVQLGGFMLGPLALILGHVSGQAAGNTSLGMLAIRNRWSLFSRVSLKNVILAARRYRRFPIYSTWGGAFNTAGTQLPPLLFAALFSASAAGIYLLAYRVLAIPMNLLGRSVADVFYGNVAKAWHNGNLDVLFTNIHDKLVKISMPLLLILILVGPELFAFVFSDNWQQAGAFARWMAPMVFGAFVITPISTGILQVKEQQSNALVFQTILLLTRLAGIGIGALLSHLILSVALFSLGSTTCYFLLLVWLCKTNNVSLFFIYRSWCYAFLWSILILAPLLLNIIFFNDKLLIGIFLSFALISIYYIFLARHIFLKPTHEKFT